MPKGDCFLTEAQRIHDGYDKQKNESEIKSRINEVKAKLETIAEHLTQIPKGVSPEPIFKQMQKLEEQKQLLEEKLTEMRSSEGVSELPSTLRSYKGFLELLRGLLSYRSTRELKNLYSEDKMHENTSGEANLASSDFYMVGRSKRLTNGDPLLITREQSYYHDITEFFVLVKEGIFAKVAPLYAKGLSLGEIAAETQIPKTTVRSALLKGGVRLRQKENSSHLKTWERRGKKGALPPYGFCYFQGEIVPHPKEYKTLLVIRKLWQKGINSNAIATELNRQRVPSRMAKEWSWNAVKNIVDRLKKNQLPIKE